jgi:hypothetical protein
MDTLKKNFPQNMSKLFTDTKILEPARNEKIYFRDLWEKNDKPLLLVYWLRRFGCIICRMSALDLTKGLESASDDVKNKLNQIAVGFTQLDYEEFVKENYFKNGQIYIDEDKETYKALNFQKLGFLSMYGMLNPQMYVKASEAKKRGIKGNFKGEGTQLGGAFVVDRSGDVIFSHVQKNYSDNPCLEDIIKAVEAYKEPTKI